MDRRSNKSSNIRDMLPRFKYEFHEFDLLSKHLMFSCQMF